MTTGDRGLRVLVIGAGAIGGFYGSILQRGGCRVELVARSDADAMRAGGVRIDSDDLGDLSYRPAAVYGDVADVAEPPEVVLLAVKVVDGLDRAALLRPVVGPATTIVLVQNGVDIEPPIQAAFPDNPVLSGLAFVAVSRVGPAHLAHKAYGRLVLGACPGSGAGALEALATRVEAGGVACTVSHTIVAERWRKAVWNAVFNPVSVLAGGAATTTLLDADDGEALITALVDEVCQTAAAAGYPQKPDLAERILSGTRRMPAYHNSMALDYLHGRPMEVETILGNVVRAAHRHQVAVPRLETVYALMKAAQHRVTVEG